MTRLRTWVASVVVGILAVGGVSPAAAEDVSTKVIGGTDAAIADAPWQVALIWAGGATNNDGQFCGGSILNATWVVTAAHCVTNPAIDEPSEIKVVAGTAVLTADKAGQLSVAEIVRHPSYVPTDFGDDPYDIALLRLASPLVLEAGVRQSIALPIAQDPDTWPAAGTDALITGWGNTSTTVGAYPTNLKKAIVDVLGGPSAACGAYGALYEPDSMLCAGLLGGGIDTCQGDSGGPLAINVSGTWTLAGITSWGVGCAVTDFPGVYTRVSTYDTWVVPGAPTGVEATLAADTGVALTWTAPSGIVSSPITDYVVSHSSDSGATWSTPVATGSTSTSYTITGLTAGTEYLFRVGAVNAVNAASGPAGPVGATATAVAPALPLTVTATATATGQSTATISIDATGTPFASDITGWAFTALSGGGTLGTPALAAATVTIPVTGLSAGTSYTWTIQAAKPTVQKHVGTTSAITTTAASGGGGGGGGGATTDPTPAPPSTPVVPSPDPTPEPTPEPTPPAGDPAPPAVITSLGSGISLVPQPRVTPARVPASGPVARTRAGAPTIEVPARRTVIPVLRGLRPSTEFTVWIRLKQTAASPPAWARMGATTSSAAGVARLPAFRAAMKGTFPLRLTAPGVKTAYAEVTVVSPR